MCSWIQKPKNAKPCGKSRGFGFCQERLGRNGPFGSLHVPPFNCLIVYSLVCFLFVDTAELLVKFRLHSEGNDLQVEQYSCCLTTCFNTSTTRERVVFLRAIRPLACASCWYSDVEPLLAMIHGSAERAFPSFSRNSPNNQRAQGTLIELPRSR